MVAFDYEYFWLVVGFIIVVALCPTMLYIGKKYVKPFVDRHNGIWYEVLDSLFKTPFIVAVFVVASFVVLKKLNIQAEWMIHVFRAYGVLFALNVVWFLVDLINDILDKVYERSTKNKDKKIDINIIKTAKKAVSVFLWFIGIIWALDALGVDVKALIATLGIGGVAIAFAAQETVKNVIGGITIIVDRTLRIGDTVNVSGVEGTVEDIGLRSTKVRAYSGRIVTIPNSKLVDTNIENITTEPTRKVVCKLGLTYDTTPDKMEEALDILKNLPTKITSIDEKVVPYFSSYGDSSLNITFTYYIKHPRKVNIFSVQSDVNMEILRSFNKAGLNFAFPTQTIYIEK